MQGGCTMNSSDTLFDNREPITDIYRLFHFGSRVSPRWSLVIALVRRSMVRPSLNISETAHFFFLIFCMKLGHYKGTKVTEPDFWKKIWGSQIGENPHFWGIFEVFCPYLCIQSLKVSEISHTLQAQYYPTHSENCMSRKIWFWLYSRDQTPIFETS